MKGESSEANSQSINTNDNISRDPGTPTGLGAVAGAGYRGKRDDQDDAVKTFATRLEEEFPHTITIRFNTNQLSGSAWLEDSVRDSQVGLGAKLKPPQWYQDAFEEYLHGDGEEPSRFDINLKNRRLVHTVKLTVAVIDEATADQIADKDDKGSLIVKEFEQLEDAWNWFIEHVDRTNINPPS